MATFAENIASAVALSDGIAVNDSIDTSYERDWYAIQLAAGQSVQIDLTGFDTQLYLYDALGNELAYNDDGGEGNNAKLQFTATTAGTYYIAAAGYDEDTGSYSLLAQLYSNDILIGRSGDDELSGGLGNDALLDAAGSNLLDGGDGNDYLYVTGGSNTLLGGQGNDTLIATAGDVTLNGGSGSDSLVGGSGRNTFVFNSPYSLPYDPSQPATIDVAVLGGNDIILFEEGIMPGDLQLMLDVAGNVVLMVQDAAMLLSGTASNPALNPQLVFADGTTLTLDDLGTSTHGSDLADIVSGSVLRDYINGGAGNDVISAFTPGSSRSDTLDGGSGNDLLIAGNGDDSLLGSSGNDTLFGNAGNDTLNGGTGADLMEGGAGNDTYAIENANDLIIETLDGGIDRVNSSISYTLGNNIENLVLYGIQNLDGIGNELHNRLIGNIGNNLLAGLDGNDTLTGGAGADTLDGGAGNDNYYVDADDIVIEEADMGSDRVYAGISYSLGANLEHLSLTGTADLNGSGNELANSLIGNVGNNQLSGGAGNDTLNGIDGSDTLIGGSGNDTYYADSSDVLVEDADGGTDLVYSSSSYSLGANLENLTLQGTAAINGYGNELSNSLIGNSSANQLEGNEGNDTLNGGAGNDTLLGGTGDDIYYVDSLGDLVVEATGGGIDRILSSVSLTLAANVEILGLTGSNDISGFGNELNNTLNGNSGNNLLGGGAGNDVLRGNAGSDTLIGGSGADTFDFDRLSDSGVDAGSRDFIFDFEKGIDRIDLSGIDANSDIAGNQAFAVLIAGTDAFSAAGQLKLVDGVLYGNTDADADAEFSIALVGISTLELTDIIR